MTKATLKEGESHPMARSAFVYVSAHLTPTIIEAISSTALSGDRTAEICYSTMHRVTSGDPVSDRYILGLAWLVKELEEADEPL